VIPKVPVGALHEFDIGTERDQEAAGFQTAGCLMQSEFQALFVRKVFKEITGENDIESRQGVAMAQSNLGK